jgi:transcription initiation factor IIE alpha subunit
MTDERPFQSHSPTSQAAASAVENPSSARARVLQILRERGPLTDNEIQELLRMDGSTERPRRIELRRARRIEIAGLRRTRSGRLAVTWKALDETKPQE